jgi:hypothetical protein
MTGGQEKLEICKASIYYLLIFHRSGPSVEGRWTQDGREAVQEIRVETDCTRPAGEIELEG